MEAIMHTLGLCSDSTTHPDLLNFFAYNYNEFVNIINIGINYFKK